MSIDKATGERGVFKFEQPKYKPTKVNHEALTKGGERGEWRYDLETNKLVPFERDRPKQVHSVITDEISPTLSMTGSDRVYTSKRKLRQEYRELGFVETGGEQPRAGRIDKEARRRQIMEDAQKAANLVKYGMAPLTEKEREQCLREEREYQKYKSQKRR